MEDNKKIKPEDLKQVNGSQDYLEVLQGISVVVECAAQYNKFLFYNKNITEADKIAAKQRIFNEVINKIHPDYKKVFETLTWEDVFSKIDL